MTDDKFICTIGKFHQLIEVCWCKVCGKQRKIIKHGFVGSVLEVQLTCDKKHGTVTWASSPQIGRTFTVNFQISNAILLSGNLYVKFSLFAKFLKLQIPSHNTLYRTIKKYTAPQIEWWWGKMQDAMINLFRGMELYLGGDARNDSPGHCATYSTYSFIEPISNLILRQEIIDVRQAQLKSPNMEKIGCENGLKYMRNIRKIKVKGLKTDDHSQISAMISKSA